MTTTAMRSGLAFACPECRIALETSGNRLVCPRCAFAGSRLDVGFVFDESDWYYGVIPQEVMRDCLQQAETVGWREAVEKCVAPDYPNRAKMMSDDTRADWRYLLDLGPDKRVLDAGAGYGTLSFAIARDVESVWAAEKTRERFDFIRLRARQDGVRNVNPVCADVLAMPFGPGSFDVVIVMGVLEWLGLSREGNPRDIQLGFLRDLHEILTASGQLVLGIENRFGIAALRGAKDHSQLRYTSIMPRVLASLAVNRAQKRTRNRMHTTGRGTGYRTYTYGPVALKRLLTEAGFGNVQLHSAIPTYRKPHTLIPLSPPAAMRAYLTNPGIPRPAGWAARLRAVGMTSVETFIRRWYASHFIVTAERRT